MAISPHGQNLIWTSFTKGPMQPVLTPVGLPDYNVKRLDLLQSWATGNKYYKLKYVLQEVLITGVKTIVSKGGMFSNHLSALSSACKTLDIALIAVVRSYSPDERNPSILRLRTNGDEVLYLTPSAYNVFNEEQAKDLYPEAMFVPEGGLTTFGIKGAAEIAAECMENSPSHVILAGGTLTTACGILSALPNTSHLIVVPAWKGCSNAYFEDLIDKYAIQYKSTWELWPEYHFGGFGKFNQKLVDFMKSYTLETGIPLDPVYTGKLTFAIQDKLSTGYFKSTDSIVSIHSGGLQGLEGYKYRFPEIWK